MKKIHFKAFEEDGQRVYVYELPEEAELDEDTLDLCEDGALRGIVPMEYVDDADAFYYDVTGYKTLGRALSGEVDSSDVLEVLYGVAKVLVEFKENNIPISHLIFHKDFIFIDRMTMEVKFLCVPLEETDSVNMLDDLIRFVRVLLSGLTYDISEDGSYVTKLLTLVNTAEQFNISIFVNVLQDLMTEYGIMYEDMNFMESFVDYEDEDGISTIDTSILDSMPESVSVAEMEAEALRQEAEEAGQYAEEIEPEPEADEDEEMYAEEIEAEPEADEDEEMYAEEIEPEPEADEDEEMYAEEGEPEPEADEDEEMYAEEGEPEADEDEEMYAEEIEAEPDTKLYDEQMVPETEQMVPEDIPISDTEVKSDAEIKRMQQEALRKIAEAEQLDNRSHFPLRAKEHKPEAAETVVKPVFDSVFEPIIESIDGPIDEDEQPRAYMTTIAKPSKNPAKSARAARAKAKAEAEAQAASMKEDMDEEAEQSVSEKVTDTAPEPTALSQLDSNADNLPKVNPYLVRVNNEERIMITKTSFRIGKAGFGVDYTVTDNGAISRNHCLIFAKDGEYYIRDNKSANHTYVNGQIVKNGEDVLLTHEASIRIADEDFLFKLR